MLSKETGANERRIYEAQKVEDARAKAAGEAPRLISRVEDIEPKWRVNAAATSFSRAQAAFDTITGASYYGFGMKEFLATNEEALMAAEKLAGFLKAAGLKGAQ